MLGATEASRDCNLAVVERADSDLKKTCVYLDPSVGGRFVMWEGSLKKKDVRFCYMTEQRLNRRRRHIC